MQIKVEKPIEAPLRALAKRNRRSPTAEANLALFFHLSNRSLSPEGKKNQRVREKTKK